MNSCSDDLKDILIGVLTEHTACIAHEINDRVYDEHFEIFFESFRNLRETRDDLISKGIIKEVLRDSPYGKPYKFFYLTTTESNKVNRIIESKHKLLLDYSRHTGEIGHLGEYLVAEAVERLGFTEVKVRKRPGKKDVDVWCKDPSGSFYWAIECKNRRQEISEADIDDALYKAELASSKWNVAVVKAAIVSSSIYYRIPEEPNLPIIPTGSVYVPNEKIFYQYKNSLGSRYLEPVNSVPNDLIKLIDKLLINKPTCI